VSGERGSTAQARPQLSLIFPYPDRACVLNSQGILQRRPSALVGPSRGSTSGGFSSLCKLAAPNIPSALLPLVSHTTTSAPCGQGFWPIGLLMTPST
jgi:hypothetical protein